MNVLWYIVICIATVLLASVIGGYRDTKVNWTIPFWMRPGLTAIALIICAIVTAIVFAVNNNVHTYAVGLVLIVLSAVAGFFLLVGVCFAFAPTKDVYQFKQDIFPNLLPRWHKQLKPEGS